MKTTSSVLWDVDVCEAARAYAAEKGISLSRLVQEMMIETLGIDGRLDPEKKAAIEKRIAKRPGRRPRDNGLPAFSLDDPRHPNYNDDE